MKRLYALILAIIVGALVTAVATKETATLSWPSVDDAKQLKFSHSFHMGAGMACTDCHAARESKLSSDNLRATHDNCKGCHQEQVDGNCAYCHKNPDEIPPVVPATRSIIFSHEQHVNMKNVECAACHAGLDQADYAGPASMPTMATCNTCHNDAKATSTCEACHTGLTNLIPGDHLVANFKKEHKKLTRLGMQDVSCNVCHSQNFCADCHAAAGLVRIGTGGLMSDPTPKAAPSDLPRPMALQNVHSLNFRFTHGMEARSKSADCYSCHSQREFCAECHTGGGVSAQAAVPPWHVGANFATFGVGSGGGRHADFARRDIESCIMCHDVRNADPVCITCHVDPDGIRGTSPKTHPAGFMRGEKGDWHNTPSSTCFNCHTDFNARPDGKKGLGFCGYCHG